MSATKPAVARELGEAMSHLDVPVKKRLDSNSKTIDENDSHLLLITNVLQTSLDPVSILEIFAEEAIEVIPFDSLTYKSRKHSIKFESGTKSSNVCTYKLEIKRETLGEITLTRAKRFTKSEINAIENLLCTLIYPLRNAFLYKKALKEAKEDQLSGLYNRSYMDEVLSREVKIAQRHSNNELALIVVDIDHFKKINDTYGHSTGDCLIKALADILQSTIRSIDMAFRYGGEEFVLLLRNTDTTGATTVAERIRVFVAENETYCLGKAIKMTASLGVTMLGDGDTEKSLFLRADKALYEAKNSGRNQVITS
jgi:diguanylate cyclase (GGDEF)-like protein